MRQLDEVSLRLLKAAEVLRKRGWCQGHVANQSGNVCALGAIWLSGSRGVESILDGQADQCEDRVLAHIRAGRFSEPLSVPDWNDTPGRTADEVIHALEAAAFGANHVAQADNPSAT